MANGFGNRFLWFCTRRSKTLPEGGNLNREELVPLAERLRDALEHARRVGELRRDERARAMWHEVYPNLSEGQPGLLGAMTARAEAQVMRIACIYALLDKAAVIRQEHLLAGLALWEYCEASARYIFGERLGDPVADTVLRALRQAPDGLSRTDLQNLFARHRRSADIVRTLAMLVERGLARCGTRKTGGRPVELWFATTGAAV